MFLVIGGLLHFIHIPRICVDFTDGCEVGDDEGVKWEWFEEWGIMMEGAGLEGRGLGTSMC